MRVQVLTLRYSATLGVIDSTPLSDFTKDKQVLSFRETFFRVQGVPHPGGSASVPAVLPGSRGSTGSGPWQPSPRPIAGRGISNARGEATSVGPRRPTRGAAPRRGLARFRRSGASNMGGAYVRPASAGLRDFGESPFPRGPGGIRGIGESGFGYSPLGIRPHRRS